MTVEDWDRAFSRALPVASLGLGVFSAAMAILAVQRYGTLAQRVYHENGRYLVSVRNPGQLNFLQEFVQPGNPDVIAIHHQYGPDYWALYDFVCRNISYRKDIGEWWAFPSEVLTSGTGDCEDTSNLLTSLLRCGGVDAYTVLGDYQGYGHAWSELGGQILESTYTSARLVPDPEDYLAFILFNDQEVIELWPGALEEVFSLQRNEATKLNLMAEAVG